MRFSIKHFKHLPRKRDHIVEHKIVKHQESISLLQLPVPHASGPLVPLLTVLLVIASSSFSLTGQTSCEMLVMVSLKAKQKIFCLEDFI